MLRTRAIEFSSWCLTDHACRVCFGRILSRPLEDGSTCYRCANCGTEVVAHHPKALCCCGLKTANGRDAGFRCVRNTEQRPENPVEILVRFTGVDEKS